MEVLSVARLAMNTTIVAATSAASTVSRGDPVPTAAPTPTATARATRYTPATMANDAARPAVLTGTCSTVAADSLHS